MREDRKGFFFFSISQTFLGYCHAKFIIFGTVSSLFFYIAAFMPEDSVPSSHIHRLIMESTPFSFFITIIIIIIQIICDLGVICGPGSFASLYTVFKHRFFTCVGINCQIRHVIFLVRYLFP